MGITQMKTPRSAVSDVALPFPTPGVRSPWHPPASEGRHCRSWLAAAGTLRGLGTSPCHLQLCQEDRVGGRLGSRAACRELGLGENRAERLSLPAARAGDGWLSLLQSLCFSLWSLLAPVGQATLGSGRGRAAACDKCDSLAMASPFTVTVCFCLLVQ